MKPLELASGDLLADRRADYAEMLFRAGDHAAAAEVMLGALELAPGWAMGWFRLGEMQEAADDRDQAAAAWRIVLRLDPADRPGSLLKLELIGAAPISSAPPAPFVEALFDHYAATFDEALVGKLAYRVPEFLAGLISGAGRQFESAIDLGCGTGLTGVRLRPMTRRLEGVDISAAMLRKAAARGCYDRLVKADLQTLALPAEGFDLAVAADVLMYVGALDDLFSRVATALLPGGQFAFSAERHAGPEPYRLQESRRYAHSEAAIRNSLSAARLVLLRLTTEVIRMDRGEPVEGLIVLAEKPRLP